MEKLSKLILPILIFAAVFLVYKFYFAPTNDLGSFSKFSTGSEINQEINVAVVHSKGFKKNKSGEIVSFYARDINNTVVLVVAHESISDEIVRTKIVSLLGHMHTDNFAAAKVNILD